MFGRKWKKLYLELKANRNISFSEFAFKNNRKIKSTYNLETMARDVDNVIRIISNKLHELVPPFKITIQVDDIDELLPKQ
jgi:hypothetical protein